MNWWQLSHYDCVFKHSANVNQKRVCSPLRERRQNDEILPNFSNYLFKRAIQSPQLTTGRQIFNTFKVNHWVSVAATGSCEFTQATALVAFLQRSNCCYSVTRVNRPLAIFIFSDLCPMNIRGLTKKFPDAFFLTPSGNTVATKLHVVLLWTVYYSQ